MKNYLKHWRVVRYFVKKKYNIGLPELEMLLFLYDEGRFSKDVFKQYEELMSWNKNRFFEMIQKGYIVIYRKKEGRLRALYELSYKSKGMIASVYEKLEGGRFPITESSNPLFGKKVNYVDKVYRNEIKRINKGRPPHHLQR